jgi:hypothetical protein
MPLKQKLKYLIFHFLLYLLPSQKADLKDKSLGVCILLPHRYVDLFIYSLHSFYYFLGRALPIYIVNDPLDKDPLTTRDIELLRKHFSVIIDSRTAPQMKALTKKHPHLYKYRFDLKSAVSKSKFDALLLNPFQRTISMDSDIIFFRPPTEVIDFILNRRKSLRYVSRVENAQDVFPILRDPELFLRLMLHKYLTQDKPHFDPFFTSGLLCIPDKKFINLRKLDQIFRLFYKVQCAHDWLAEERAVGMMIDSKTSAKLEPTQYFTATYWEQYQSIDFGKVIAIHYQGIAGLKRRFITDALKQMFSTYFFRKNFSK